jgi:hypothetical protein
MEFRRYVNAKNLENQIIFGIFSQFLNSGYFYEFRILDGLFLVESEEMKEIRCRSASPSQFGHFSLNYELLPGQSA